MPAAIAKEATEPAEVRILQLKPKVLVVDDDEVNRKIWKDVLLGLCQLEFASNGRDALDLFPRFRPALVVLDRMMPGLSGDEVMARIRLLDPEGETKIVMHSMLETSAEQIDGMKKGADLYIPKSTDIDVAVTHIQSMLRLQKNSQSAALFKIAREQNRSRSFSSKLIAEGIFRHASLLTDDIRARKADLIRITDVSAHMLRNVEGNSDIAVRVEAGTGEAVVLGDDDLLVHAILSVMQRACEVTPAGETVDVVVGREGRHFTIAIEDRGPVIPAAEWRDLFHFVCSPEKIQVGLPIAWETAQRHFGDLTVASNETGMVFTFWLPTPDYLEEMTRS